MRFSLTLHIILAATAIGVAAGCNQVGGSPIWCYSLNGLAAGLAITALARTVDSL